MIVSGCGFLRESGQISQGCGQALDFPEKGCYTAFILSDEGKHAFRGKLTESGGVAGISAAETEGYHSRMKADAGRDPGAKEWLLQQAGWNREC